MWQTLVMKKTTYEWDREIQDIHGDIVEHCLDDKYRNLPTHEDCMEMNEAAETKVYLVMSIWIDDELDFRARAEVVDHKLPERFSLPGHTGSEPCGYKVAQRFHKEVAR